MIQRLHVHIVDSNSTRRAAIARELYGRTIHVEEVPAGTARQELLDGGA